MPLALLCRTALLAAAVAAGTYLHAQAVSGTISGSVIDPSGSAVPSAKVSARNTATNVETNALTSAAGFYTILHLVPGTYAVKVEAPGFRRFSTDTVAVSVDSVARLDVALEVGEVTNQITV